MKKNLILISFAYLISGVTISHAADIIYNSPQEPIYDEAAIWNGAYIGAQLGYGWVKNYINFKDNVDDHNDNTLSSNGLLGGLYAGYNWELSNRFLIGLEADIAFQNTRSDYTANSSLSSANNDPNWKRQIQWSGAARARLGVNYERILPYIAGGVAFAGIKDSLSNGDNPFSFNNNFLGFTIGAGIDYSVTNNIILRAEYRYTDYGSKSNVKEFDTRLKMNDIRLGLAYRF